MTGNTQHIVKQLFGDTTLENVSVQQLEELVLLYPSFSIGHYLLSKKLQQEGNTWAFSQQTQKTALYFSNPFWLQWLLKNARDDKPAEPPQTFFTPPMTETEALDERDPDDTEAGQHEMDEQISKRVSEQAVHAALEINEKLPAFEPYHTIDYFASQGIRFVQEMNPQDKLGRQLKSFTEWLKTMKKLPQKMTEPSPSDEAIDAIIEVSAAHSIEDKEVLTETMAEVLIKQGKSEKAAEVYRKLSLLNPDKSAYFAARIEQLKVH